MKSSPSWSKPLNAFGIESGWVNKAWDEQQHPRNSHGMFTHIQTLVDSPHGSVEVDRGMAPTLQAFWRHGFDTLYSCQGNKRGDGGYIFMKDDGRWNKLVRQWKANKKRYPPKQQALIDRISNAKVPIAMDEDWVEYDGDKLPWSPPHDWAIERNKQDSFGRGKTIILRIPAGDVPLLGTLMDTTPTV